LKAKKVLSELYYYLLEHPDVLERELKKMEMGQFPEGTNQERKVCDLVASMTDRYALSLYEDIFFPTPVV
jgi:dGTPase